MVVVWWCTYLAVITVNEQGVIAAVQHHAENRLHRLYRDLLLFRPLHIKHFMLDSILVKKSNIALRELLLNQGAGQQSQLLCYAIAETLWRKGALTQPS